MIELDKKFKEHSLENKLEKYWFDNGFINENCKFKRISEFKPKEDVIYLFTEFEDKCFVNEFIGTTQQVREISRLEKNNFTHFLELPINTIK